MINIFRKLMIWHCWQSPFFPLFPSNYFLTKKLKLKLDSAASTGSKGKYMKCESLPLPSVVAAHDSKSTA
jgi:hypothetical protein